MANLDFVVDTTPMANRVDRMTTGVISVQSAVHVMEEEIVKSEQDAAKKISSNVTYGFYMLARNQFSQKEIVFNNEVTTNMTMIQNFMKDLNQIKSRMERDYNVISRQYLKLFSRIDNSLRSSIKDLDDSLLSIVIDGREEMNARVLNGPGKVISYDGELLPITQLLAVGTIKKKCKSLLQRFKSVIDMNFRLRQQFKECLEDRSTSGGIKTIFVPVVVIEHDSLVDQTSSLLLAKMPQFPSEIKKHGNDIHTAVLDASSVEDSWINTNTVHLNLVRQEFLNLLKTYDENRRNLMIRLFDQSSWKELGRG